jgi:hypothetical protein
VHGGPTRTRAPEIGSPVLDAGPGIPGITKDQRGEARSSLAVDKVDIGAVEGTGSCGSFQAPADPAPVASPPSAPLNVTADGTFDWQRRTGKKIYIIFKTVEGSVQSSRIIIR